MPVSDLRRIPIPPLATATATATEYLTLVISGSRTIRSADLIWPVLDERAAYLMAAFGRPLHLHLGDAQGVDWVAAQWARARGVEPRSIFFANLATWAQFETRGVAEIAIPAADWESQGRGAGAIRNTAMLTGCSEAGGPASCRSGGARRAVDVLLAVWDGSSRGTLNAIGQAKSRGVAVHRYDVSASAGAAEWLEDEAQ